MLKFALVSPAQAFGGCHVRNTTKNDAGGRRFKCFFQSCLDHADCVLGTGVSAVPIAELADRGVLSVRVPGNVVLPKV